MALIVVSNRVTVPGPGEAVAGGLAVALSEAIKKHGGTWLGWSGEKSDAPSELQHSDVDGIHYGRIDLTPQDYDEYYTGFANRVLWPLMHYRLGLIEFHSSDYAGYRRVNGTFARHVSQVVTTDDLIWVHDYHLMPLAQGLRAAGVLNRLGYFHHIPWPSPDVFSILPSARDLLLAMTEYDLIGLQTVRDASHFGACLVEILAAVSLGDGAYQVGGRNLRVTAIPIGIDAASLADVAAGAFSDPIVRETASSMAERDIIIGVDRLDYSKGVAQRMEAYALFLDQNEHRRSKVEYLQITPLSRSDIPEYEAINHSVAETAGRINGRSGEPARRRADGEPL